MRRIAAAVAGVVLLAGCNPRVEATATSTPSPSPTATGIKLRIIGRGTATRPVRILSQLKNRIEYDLLAKSYLSIGAQGSERVEFTDVHVTFRAKDGTLLIADAPHAVLDQIANTITLTGGVHAHNSSGTSMQCDRMLYQHASQEVYGYGHVLITSKNGGRVSANKFQSDISLTHTRMQ